MELQTLDEVLSPGDVIAALTRNAAAYLDLSDEIGTLEAGKFADIVIVDGDPLAEIADLMKAAVVIRRGEIVVDNR
jgi:imidazolonepropionase-like amidohydrolase